MCMLFKLILTFLLSSCLILTTFLKLLSVICICEYKKGLLGATKEFVKRLEHAT